MRLHPQELTSCFVGSAREWFTHPYVISGVCSLESSKLCFQSTPQSFRVPLRVLLTGSHLPLNLPQGDYQLAILMFSSASESQSELGSKATSHVLFEWASFYPFRSLGPARCSMCWTCWIPKVLLESVPLSVERAHFVLLCRAMMVGWEVRGKGTRAAGGCCCGGCSLGRERKSSDWEVDYKGNGFQLFREEQPGSQPCSQEACLTAASFCCTLHPLEQAWQTQKIQLARTHAFALSPTSHEFDMLALEFACILPFPSLW